MKLTLLLVLALGTAASAQDAQPAGDEAPGAPPLLLRLRDGATHWGSILKHDADGLDFVLLSHGGQARVPWMLLEPRQSAELQKDFGYVEVSSDEVLIEADRLLLVSGEEVLGKIVSREGEHFLVKVEGNLQAVPKTRVASVQGGVPVPALDVYSQEELYQQYLAQADPTDPESLLELARGCERILDFAHAAEHYQMLGELAPDFMAEAVAEALDRAQRSALLQEQIEFLRDADQLRKRKSFDDALAKVALFSQQFPDSPMLDRARRLEMRIQEARYEALRAFVRIQWHDRLRKLARERARETTYVEALTYAEEQLSQDIAAAVLSDVHKRISESVQESELRELWNKRDKVVYQLASYGEGTWLLGEDRARKGLDEAQDEEGKSPTTQMDAERAKLEEKIKRFIKNQEAARRAKRQQGETEDYELFWKGFDLSGRAQWIRAYYAEFSGDMELAPRPRFQSCPGCGGRGVREVVHVGGTGTAGDSGLVLNRCELCQGIGVLRKVRYR